MMLALDMEELGRNKISCDGAYPGTNWVCFTDKDFSSPSYGASFDVRINGAELVAAHIPIRRVLAALKRVRAKFRSDPPEAPATTKQTTTAVT